MNLSAVHQFVRQFVDEMTVHQNFIGLRANGGNGMIYLIDSPLITEEYIKKAYQICQEEGVFAGFLVDIESIPEAFRYSGGIGVPPEWMQIIHALGWGKIYTWTEFSAGSEVRALHLESMGPMGAIGERMVMWDDFPLQRLNFHFTQMESKTPLFPGTWPSMTFGGKAFWMHNRRRADAQKEAAARERQKKSEDFKNSAGYADFKKVYEDAKQRANQPPPKQNNSAMSSTVACATLGLPQSSKLTYEQARVAYRKAATEWHPDLNKSPEAEQRMREVNLAFEYLCFVYSWRAK